MATEQENRTLEDVIFDLKKDSKRYSGIVTESWNKMMFFASLRALSNLRAELYIYLNTLGDTSKVKKHTKKLKGFFATLNDLDNIDLNSTTYIKKVLTPAKNLREEFEAWKKLSIKNMIDEDAQADIKAEAEEIANARVTKVEEIITTKAA